MNSLQERSRQWRSPSATIAGFSLIELLVTLGIIAVLTTLTAPLIKTASKKVAATQCLAKMRNLGQGILLYAQDDGEFPRSYHSSAGAGKPPWAQGILPYLGLPADPDTETWSAIFEKHFRCPADPNKNLSIYSYALNVFFELTPDGDDYAGSPVTWRKPISLPAPTSTILLAEPKPVYYADHLMCHQWTSAKGATNAVDAQRHSQKSNYLFTDGHVEALPIEKTFSPTGSVNLWNPSLAGKK